MGPPVMLVPLQSVPALKQVDTDIFELRYYGHCMQCTFCSDWCCQWGCDVNLAERDQILAAKEGLKRFVKAPVEQWFEPDVYEDPEYPTGRYVRAAQVNGACVFRSQDGRGCNIHRYAMAEGRDYHAIKPMVCWLFPVCWDQGVLEPSGELREDLVCKGNGPTLYDMVRDELRHAFGAALIDELDAVRAKHAPRHVARKAGDVRAAP
jgi:Fe-S-cluster containining protein